MIVLIIKKKKKQEALQTMPCMPSRWTIYFFPTNCKSKCTSLTNKKLGTTRNSYTEQINQPWKTWNWRRSTKTKQEKLIVLEPSSSPHLSFFSLSPLGTTILHFSSHSILPSHLFFMPVKKTKTALKNNLPFQQTKDKTYSTVLRVTVISLHVLAFC